MEYPRDYRKGPPEDLAAEPPDSLVIEAQELLATRGYDIGKTGATGVLDDSTQDAIEIFRIHNDLPVNRILDANFLDALQREDTVASQNEQPIDQDPRITALEEALKLKGVVTEADLITERAKL